MSSDSRVELIRPPITATAMGWRNSDPVPRPIAVGSATSQVATLTLLIQPVLSEPEYLPNGMMRFKLLGNSNQTYLIEASTNLVDWPALTNLLATNALTPFTDGTSAGLTNRFYRARIVP